MTVPYRRLLLEGGFVDGEARALVRSPWSGEVVAEVAQASAAQAERALAFAAAQRGALAAQGTGERRRVLLAMSAALTARSEEVARLLVAEAGKPLAQARVEVARAAETFLLAAAHASTLEGRTVPVDGLPAAKGTECEVRRFPAGVVVGVVPFNFPLNLGAHKVAPALAVGAPIVVKPPPQAPSAQLLLGELAAAAGAHPAALQVLPCAVPVAEALACDARVRVLSFTGSAQVGWHLKQRARARAVLELGGNAAAVVCADADLGLAAQRVCASAFGYAGQVCIKTQRVLVEERVHRAFLEAFLERVDQVQAGDPAREEVLLGPVIDDAAAFRIEAWVGEATAAGARALRPLRREGRLLHPCVLEAVPHDARVWTEEVFGPVVAVEGVPDFDAALARVNESRYGLQAGVFTHDWRKARRAYRELEVGGVVVNDAPSFRSDAFPYGGVKDSGLGREGVLSAMHDYTEERALLWRPA